MNRKELCSELNVRLDLTLAQAQRVVSTVFELLSDSLGRGERVEIRGFGTLEPRTHKQRVGINNLTGKHTVIPERIIHLWRPGQEVAAKLERTVKCTQDSQQEAHV